mmetsp:Transcript_46943/g.101983  ORF Transcript_46943/g.101983 Transcript_46943/m.101983 type:complete len:118 (-) Transcript_46943:16-369(-)
MTVSDIEVSVDGCDIERELAKCVCPVNEDKRAFGSEHGDELADRKQEAGVACDVVDNCKTDVWRKGLFHLGKELGGRGETQVHGNLFVNCSGRSTSLIQHVDDRSVADIEAHAHVAR